jgi:TPR repeat protein
LSRFLDFTPAHHDESGSLSGPSFLGLSGAAESAESEEESQARQWPRYVAAAVIAALVGLTAMHWTSFRGAAARYARLGTTYVEMLRAGKTGSSAKNSEPASAGPVSPASAVPPASPVSPAASVSNDKSTSDFALAQHPAQPVAPESPAPAAGQVPPNPTNLNLEGKAGSSDSAGRTQAVRPRQPAAGGARPTASNPSDQQFSKPVAGQREYQQALGATNPEVARALLWRATALGNSDAQVRLADMYIYGQGVPKNCDQGLILLRLAAQRANPQAQAKLGALYATGVCVSQDRVQAYRWLTLALKDGQRSEWTEQNRQMVWRQMSPEERSRAATATR